MQKLLLGAMAVVVVGGVGLGGFMLGKRSAQAPLASMPSVGSSSDEAASLKKPLEEMEQKLAEKPLKSEPQKPIEEARVPPFGSLGPGSTASAEKALKIADGMRVTMEYTLTLSDKTVADTTKGQPPFSYIQGKQEIIPGLEKALVGLKAGDKKNVTIPVAEAYGPYDEKKKVEVPKKNVPPDVKVGTKLRAANGMEAKVIELKKDSVVVDVNHPLAGKDLTFDVNIVNVETVAPTPAK